jgi:hypothetical protein
MKLLPSKGSSPHAHNLMRNMERKAHKEARRKVHVRKTNGGRIPRKRKKYVHQTERKTYAGLLIKMTLHLAKKGQL